MADNVETEFKLRSPHPIEIAMVDAAVRDSAFDCDAATSQRHSDVYLDDARRSLAASGIGLRIRVARGISSVTCKSRGSRSGALFVREEHEARWPSPTAPGTAADLPQPLRDAIEPLLLRRPLLPVLRLEIERDVRRLTCADHALCELAVDHVSAHGAGRSVQFTEVELEVADDLPSCEKLAEHLEQALHVQPASNDKPTHAGRLLGLASNNGAPAADALAPASNALKLVLRRQLAGLQRAEIAVRQHSDAESLHSMRIALRRLRSIVSGFAQIWPPEQHRWLRAHLRALGAELGRVRDLDVMALRLPGEIGELPQQLQPPAEHVLEWLRTCGRQAHDDLGAWLRSPQRLDDAQRFVDLLHEFAPDSELGELPMAAAARSCLQDEAKRLRRRIKKLTEEAPIELFHKARIAAKRLRYLSEELGDYVEDNHDRLQKRLTRLQQGLGELCDHDAGVRQLLAWQPKIGQECATQLATAALGALVQRSFTNCADGRGAALASAVRERRRLRLPS